MQQLFPGLYQLSRGANFFLLETGVEELTLIDTGIPGTTGLVLDALKALGKQPQHLKYILITHADFDHVGSLSGLVALTGATVFASHESTPYIEDAKTPSHSFIPMNFFAGTIQTLFQPKARVDKQVKDGELLDIGGGILAIATPGHTPDHYSYYWRREGVLFAGDLFFTQTGSFILTPSILSWDMNAARSSALKAFELAPIIICVGHGQPVNVANSPTEVNALRRKLEGGTSLAPV